MASPASTNDAHMTLTGDKQFIRDINLLQGRLARKNVLNYALRPAARYIKRAMKNEAPVGPTRNMQKSIQIKTLRGSPAVVVRSNFEKSPHTFIVTQGTEPRKRKNVWSSLHGRRFPAKSGNTGRMTPNDFIGRAINKSQRQARRLIVQGLERLLGR